MKKLLIAVLLICVSGVAYAATPISVDSFLSPDDVTVTHLNTFRQVVVDEINNFQGGLIQKSSISGDAMDVDSRLEDFREEAFNDWVYYGLIMPTSASLSSTTTAGVGYVHGNRIEKDATLKAYTASKWTWVELNPEGAYLYVEGTIGDTDPALDNVNSMRIARVSTDGTTVVAIRDDRIMAISLDNTQADPLRFGMEMIGTNITTDVIQINPGICYWGNIRRVKTTLTTLGLGTAGDWIAGQAAANNTMGFVVMNSAGSIKLTTTAPTLHDFSGTTDGIRYYSDVGGSLYRVLAWFYMSNIWDGSIDIMPWEWGNFGADMPWGVSRSTSPDEVTTTAYWIDVSDQTVNFYSSGGRLGVTGTASGYSTTGSYAMQICLNLDGQDLEATAMGNSSTQTTAAGSGGAGLSVRYVTPDTSQGNHTVKLRWNQELGYTAHLLKSQLMVEEN